MYLRRDIGQRDREQEFLRQHSDDSLRQMAQNGIDLFITHYYKGFGWEIIQEELPDIKRQVRTLHKAGARVGVYLRMDNILMETFFLECPEARGWLVKAQDGSTPTVMGRCFRLRVCRNAPGYRKFIARVIRYAVSQLRVDNIHLDGFHGASELQECRCSFCQERFAAFLTKRWAKHPQAALQRFGFSRVDGIEIPAVGPGNRSESTAELITDPVYQEYIRFRCEDWAEWHRYVMRLVTDANPQVVVSLNCGVFAWQNTTSQMGVYLPLLVPKNTIVFIEDGHLPGVRENGVLCHRIRDYLVLSALGMRGIAYCRPHNAAYLKRAMAESMAFNGGILGHAHTEDDVNAVAPVCEEAHASQAGILQWRRENADLWKGATVAAEVALLRGFESMAFDCYAPWRHTMLIEETLIRHHIPYVPVFNEQLASLAKRGIRLLVLGSQSCLSPAAIRAISAFVANGGRLLVTGQSGSRTQNAQLCEKNSLILALDLRQTCPQFEDCRVPRTAPANVQVHDAKHETAFADHEMADVPAEWPTRMTLFEPVLKQGAVIYIPDITPSVPKEIWRPQWARNPATGFYSIQGETANPSAPGAKEYAYINWQLPVNAGQVVDAVCRLHLAPFLVDAPNTVAVNWLRQPSRNREILFFVNYNNEHPVLGASVFLQSNRYVGAHLRRMDPRQDVFDLTEQVNSAERRLWLPEFQSLAALVLDCEPSAACRTTCR